MPASRLTELAATRLAATGKRQTIADSQVPGLELRVSPDGKVKSWTLRYRVAGKQQRKTLGRYPALNVAAARKEAGKTLANPEAPTPQADTTTFEAVAADYITRHVQARHKRARETEQMITTKLITPWRGRPLSTITRRDVLAVLNAEMDAGRERTANKTLVVIRRLFAWTIERGLTDTNPAATVTKPGREVTRDRVLTDSELAAIWTASDRMGWPWTSLIQLLASTALRLSEIAELRWSEIDVERRCLVLSGERTKSGRSQETPLNGLALETIAELPRIGDGYVFPANRDGSTNPISGFSKMKRRLDDLSGVQDWRLHDLRRTAASHMARLGVAPQVLARVLNHSPGAALPGVLAVYNRHSYDSEARTALEGWSRELARIIGRTPAKVVALRA